MIDLDKIIYEKAKSNLRTIAIAEGWDERVLKAVDEIVKEKLCKIILIGDEEEIARKVNGLNLDIGDTRIINPKKYPKIDQFASELVELRKHKGMTLEKAKELIYDVNYFACMMAHLDLVDGVASSCICSTADFMRPAFQIIKTKPGSSLVSEVSVLSDKKNGRILFFTDGSLNIKPTPEQLAQIALNAAECVRSLDIEPKIAMLSFSTHGSGGKHETLSPILEAMDLVKKQDPKLLIDGELQADAALNPSSAKRKCPESLLKGEANVLVCPDLMSANITVHTLLQLSDSEIIYSFLMGMKKPIAIYGRSSPMKTIKNLTIVCAMQANAN